MSAGLKLGADGDGEVGLVGLVVDGEAAGAVKRCGGLGAFGCGAN